MKTKHIFPRKYKVSNVEFDTDGENVNLPKTLTIEIPENIEDVYEDIEMHISDEISNITGYCHLGYDITPKIEKIIG